MRQLRLAHTVSKAAAIAAALSMIVGPTVATAQVVAPTDLTVMPPVPHAYLPKKTAWGDPDLRGTWPIDNIASLPMQRPASFGNRFFLTDEEFAGAPSSARTAPDARYDAEDQAGQDRHGPLGRIRRSGQPHLAAGRSGRTASCPPLTPQAEALYKRRPFELDAQHQVRLGDRFRQLGPLRHAAASRPRCCRSATTTASASSSRPAMS